MAISSRRAVCTTTSVRPVRSCGGRWASTSITPWTCAAAPTAASSIGRTLADSARVIADVDGAGIPELIVIGNVYLDRRGQEKGKVPRNDRPHTPQPGKQEKKGGGGGSHKEEP